MKKKLCIILLFLFFCFSSNRSIARDKDLRIRMGVELQKEISDRLVLELIPEIRLQSRNELDELFIETGLQYDLFKYLKIGGLYRAYLHEEKVTHRFAADVKPQIKWQHLKFQYRFRYTNYTDFDLATEENTETIRHRLKVDFKIPKTAVVPYIGTELFQNTSSEKQKKIRYISGMKIKLNKGSSINAYYLIQKRLKKTKTRQILGFSFLIELK